MHRYDFDAPVNRRGTDSLKYDRALERYRDPDLLSLWVADMDFRTLDEVVKALTDRVQHGIFGYTEPGNAYYDAIAGWMGPRYGLNVNKDNVITTPSVVFALAACVRAFTEPGDSVLIQRPVYYPFSAVIDENGRRLANAPLVNEGGRYSIDFRAFERVVEEAKPKLFLLCNPHNPVGRAWTRAELATMGEICAEHGIVIASDEIHMDFARPGYEHVSLATISPEIANITVTCTSASKTFNLAGLHVANTVIENEALRNDYAAEVSSAGYSQPNALGMVATQAAYEHGAEWLAQVKEYLEGNWSLIASHLAQHARDLQLIQAESTYLAWVDCRCLGFGARQLERFVEDEAGLWLDCGDMFGPEGEGFIRINIATQRSYLERALNQLTDAIARLQAR